MRLKAENAKFLMFSEIDLLQTTYIMKCRRKKLREFILFIYCTVGDGDPQCLKFDGNQSEINRY